MKVTVIPIIIGALGMVLKGLLRELEDLEIQGQAETIHVPEKNHQLMPEKNLEIVKSNRTEREYRKQMMRFG